jgi:hypothetical protein
MERRYGCGMAAGSCGGVNPLRRTAGDITLKNVPLLLSTWSKHQSKCEV